jgi:hypothetical protein
MGMAKFRIRDKHPGSATLHVCLVADPFPASTNGSDPMVLLLRMYRI